jgi:mRNA interferase RelE/StbE
MHGILYSKDVVKAMRRLPADTKALIATRLNELAQDPYAMRNVKKLTNRPGYRLRVGDWRILYSIEGDPSRIIVIDIAPRGGVYR